MIGLRKWWIVGSCCIEEFLLFFCVTKLEWDGRALLVLLETNGGGKLGEEELGSFTSLWRLVLAFVKFYQVSPQIFTAKVVFDLLALVLILCIFIE